MSHIKIIRREQEKTSKIKLVKIFSANNIYASRLIENNDSIIVLTHNDNDTDNIFKKKFAWKLSRNTTWNPPELLAKNTMILQAVEEIIYDYDHKETSAEIERNHKWTEGVLESVFMFPHSRNIKVTFSYLQAAQKAVETGFRLFNLSVPSHQVKQETYIPIIIITCYMYYAIEEHAIKNCPKNSNYFICSECSEEGHSRKQCQAQTKKCLNCNEGHRTRAMRCPKGKTSVQAKNDSGNTVSILIRTTQRTTQITPTAPGTMEMIPVIPAIMSGTTEKIMTCMLHAHFQNMITPGSYELELNCTLAENNLPTIKIPRIPDPAKLMKLKQNTQKSEPQEVESLEEKTQEENTAEGPEDEDIEVEEKEETMNDKGLGLTIITNKTQGWTKPLSKKTLAEGLKN